MKMINKPTKKELLQVYYLEREIINIQNMIDDIKNSSFNSKVKDSIPTGRTNVFKDYTGEQATIIADLSAKLERLKHMRLIEKINIVEYIKGIEDSRLRQIVMLRCIKLMSWQEVANHIGGGNTAANCCVTFHRAFE